MNWFILLPLFGVLAFSSCHRNEVPAAKAVPEAGSLVNSSGSVLFSPETKRLVTSDDVPLLEQINQENAKVAARALPSLVRISAMLPPDPRLQLFGNQLSLPFHLGPRTPHGFQQGDMAYGSGVIISPDGYIVTNDHVIQDGQNLQVQLDDKRIFAARVISSDKSFDVAVLKIEARGLSPLPWGDSDAVQIGEQVFAVGNPFNLGNSVSKGVVSANGRNLPGSTNYDGFIQTDAAINPGNSGGALINVHGQLIGLNIAIASTSGQSEGVGFAIPSNLLRYAVGGLLHQGRLVRGYLGVALPVLVEEGVTGQLGLATDAGALIAGVQPSSPAAMAKLQPVDFITEINGHKINSVAELRLVVAQLPVGSVARVKYIRRGTNSETTVKLSEFPRDEDHGFGAALQDESTLVQAARKDSVSLTGKLKGLQIASLSHDARHKFQVTDWVKGGVVVSTVEEGSAAQLRGFQAGDVIEMACAQPASIRQLKQPKDLTDLLENTESDHGLVLLIHHGYTSSFIYLPPDK